MPLNYDTAVATRGTGRIKLNSRFNFKAARVVIKFALALALANVAYDFGRGIGDGQQASDTAQLVIKWTTVGVMMVLFFY